jgi:RNA polymerase sigma factor (sigma-70 family)
VSHEPLIDFLRNLRTITAPEGVGPSDAQLLARFAARRDETAFAELLQRHGGMVLGVCRRLLGDRHEAEDAFQATFLVLARKAGAGGWRDSVAGWLQAVARRVALKARSAAARRRHRVAELTEEPCARQPEEEAWADVRPVLDEELSRLPESYRTPLVLCYLEGKTNEEAARLLGRPVGTVWYQLSRGREMLRRRLGRRGVQLTAAALSVPLAGSTVQAVVPETLLATAAAAIVAGAVAAPVALLAKGVLQDMFWTRLTIVIGWIVLALAGLGAGAVAYGALPGGTEDSPAGRNVTPQPAASGKPETQPVQKGKTVPASAPVAARLVAKKYRYELDRGGLSEEEYAKRIKEGAKAGRPLPPPAVELVLELRNTGMKEIDILTGGDATVLVLDLKGPGAVSVTPNLLATLEFRMPKKINLAPGKSLDLPIKSLSHGLRGVGHMAYWTKPGQYTLTATYDTAIAPAPKDAKEAPGFAGFGRISATSAPVTLTVVEKK